MIHKNYLTALLVFISSIALYSQQNRPNVLFIIADDLGIDVTNGYQQNDRMPNTHVLDALREEG